MPQRVEAGAIVEPAVVERAALVLVERDVGRVHRRGGGGGDDSPLPPPLRLLSLGGS